MITSCVCRTLKAKRDAYVSHLNRIYRNNLDKVSVLICFYSFDVCPDHTSIFVDNCHNMLIIFCLEDLLPIICFYVRLKSKPFKVMPGLLTTLNPPWRWAGKSTQRLTSSSPLEGSLQSWVTTKFQVNHTDISLWNDHHLCFVFECVFPSVYKIKCYFSSSFQVLVWVLPAMAFSS